MFCQPGRRQSHGLQSKPQSPPPLARPLAAFGPVKLIFYDSDDEVPAGASWLIDQNATDFLEFEFMAVLGTIFARQLEAYHC